MKAEMRLLSLQIELPAPLPTRTTLSSCEEKFHQAISMLGEMCHHCICMPRIIPDCYSHRLQTLSRPEPTTSSATRNRASIFLQERIFCSHHLNNLSLHTCDNTLADCEDDSNIGDWDPIKCLVPLCEACTETYIFMQDRGPQDG